MPNGLASLKRLIKSLQETASHWEKIHKLLDAEMMRLSKNRHRKEALREAYWHFSSSFAVKDLARIFMIPPQDVSKHAGALEVPTRCLLCGVGIRVAVPNRAAREALGREKGVNPKWRICIDCRAFRSLDLGLLRKGPRERLTPAHLAAYAAYLQTPQWRERRLSALKRAKNRCGLCASKKFLNVHHRTYARIGEERKGDLIVLCRDCHKTFHEEGHTH